MASAPAFAATPRIGSATLATTNTNRDGATGTIATVLTAGAAGTQIREVDLKATGTTVAGSVVLYLHDGTTNFILTEIAVSAITAAATTASYSSSARFDNLFLPANWSLRASITAQPTSGNVTVLALGADL